MSNAAFDALVKAQEIQSAKTMIKNMEDAIASGERSEYLDRALPAQKERLAALTR